MGTFAKVVLGVVVGGLVLIVGCVAVVGIGINQASDEIQESFDERSITMAEYESVIMGETTAQEIVERFGEPTVREESLPEGSEDDPDAELELQCLSYNRKGELTSFRFCFDDGVVESKSGS